MKREVVSRDELLRLVNERVRQLLYGGACTLASVLRLEQLGGDGCNWEPFGIRGIYTHEFSQAVRDVRARYNLRDDS